MRLATVVALVSCVALLAGVALCCCTTDSELRDDQHISRSRANLELYTTPFDASDASN